MAEDLPQLRGRIVYMRIRVIGLVVVVVGLGIGANAVRVAGDTERQPATGS